MTLTIEYPATGTVRTHRGLTQRQVNKLISNLSDLQDTQGEVPVRAIVSDDRLSSAFDREHINEWKYVRGVGFVHATGYTVSNHQFGDEIRKRGDAKRATHVDFHSGEVH